MKFIEKFPENKKLIQELFNYLNTFGFYFAQDSQTFYIYDNNINILLPYDSYNKFIDCLQSFFNRPIQLQLITEFFAKHNIEYTGENLELLMQKLSSIQTIEPNPQTFKASTKEVKSEIITSIIPITDVIKRVDKNIIIKENNQNYLNIYKPSPILLKALDIMKMQQVTSKSFPNLQEFFLTFCDYQNESDTYHYLINYLAWWLQNLGKRTPQIAFFMTGVEGTGKGILVEKILKSMLNIQDYTKITTQELMKFNSDLDGKFLVYVDEIQVSTVIKDLLKNIIGNQMIKLEGKYMSSKLTKNHGLFFISKNNMKHSILDTKGNRRYSIIYNGQSLIHRWGEGKVNWFNDTFYDSSEFYAELEFFSAYLLQYKVDESQTITPLKNAIRDILEENERESDVEYITIQDRLLQAIEDAVIANNSELILDEKKKLKSMYDEDKHIFYFNGTNIRKDIIQYVSISKNAITPLLFEKFSLEYVNKNRDQKNMATYNGVNAQFLQLRKFDNPQLFEKLLNQYKRIFGEEFVDKI